MKAKTYEFPILIERDENGVLIGKCPSFKSCHTYAKTLPTLLKRMKEAIELCLEVEKDVLAPNKFVALAELEVTMR